MAPRFAGLGPGGGGGGGAGGPGGGACQPVEPEPVPVGADGSGSAVIVGQSRAGSASLCSTAQRAACVRDARPSLPRMFET